jgi:hypothetical protein
LQAFYSTTNRIVPNNFANQFLIVQTAELLHLQQSKGNKKENVFSFDQ